MWKFQISNNIVDFLYFFLDNTEVLKPASVL